ncbi:hypothetical protein CAPTEDRAFT_6295 [Capitella teleta]|uniref:Metallo-beta-lactamase domain-containing protein 1 n=1 Tax=Capitella teleta TaxID=283909 RepID=R7UBZ2_CAPTE|nr:hypothetical protein CAPTEDRAFT_6295 [Capitella teleta]|eukprot:ELU03890.1 hypothetical protein CAPTEDRAFT_6295 [Capitella teleta]
MSGVINKVTVLRTGYCINEGKGVFKANGTITLVTGSAVVLIDTGLPCDKTLLLSKLSEKGLEAEDVEYVVGTHGHSDHIGNLNLFPSSCFAVSYDVCRGDRYLDNNLKAGGSYEISKSIDVIPTPGHTGADISVIITGTEHGVTAVCEEDLCDESIWKCNSENAAEQFKHREKILHLADYIIPGHGPGFKSPFSKN